MNPRKLMLGMFAAALALALPALAGDTGKEALIKELDETGKKMERAMLKGDFDTIISYYADDAVLLPNWGEEVVGKKAIREKMEADRESGLQFESFSGRTEDAWECKGLRCRVVRPFADLARHGKADCRQGEVHVGVAPRQGRQADGPLRHVEHRRADGPIKP